MSDSSPHPTGSQLPKMEVPPDLEIEYVNLVRIAHSPSELVFDLAQLLPGTPRVSVKSRVVMSPLAAKLFHRALSENLAKYEAAFGEIRVPGGKTLADNLFHQAPPPDKPSQE